MVYTKHSFSERSTTEDIENETIKAGDIIEVDHSEEIVIGVSDDGRYITMPLEDYQLENINE